MDLIKQSLLFRASTCCRSSSEGNCWHRCLATEAHGWKFSPNGRLPPREAKEPLPFSPVVSKWVFLLMIHRTTGIPGSLENKSGKKWDLTDDENTPICVSAPWRRVYEVLTRQHRVMASTNEPLLNWHDLRTDYKNTATRCLHCSVSTFWSHWTKPGWFLLCW